jgi:hypothetical protein
VESGENATQTSGKDKNKISEIKMKIVCLLADCDRSKVLQFGKIIKFK